MRFYLTSSVPAAPGAITDRTRKPMSKKKKRKTYVFGGPRHSPVATKEQLMAAFTAESAAVKLYRQDN